MADVPSTTTTANDAVLNASIESKILLSARAALVAAPLVTKRFLPVPGPNSHTFAKFQALSATAISEGTLHEAAAATTDGVTISAAMIGVDTLLADQLTEGGVDGLTDGVILEMGNAVAAKLETDLLALGAGFSSSVGTSGVALTLAQIQTAIATLETANAPTGNVGDASDFGTPGQALTGPFFILHPKQVEHLRAAIGASGAAFWSTEAASDVLFVNADGEMQKPRGYVGRIFGIPVFQSSLCPTADGGVNRVGMLAVPSAIGLVIKYLAKHETLRDLSTRSMRHGVTSFYGVGELVDAYGVQIKTSAT